MQGVMPSLSQDAPGRLGDKEKKEMQIRTGTKKKGRNERRDAPQAHDPATLLEGV